MSFEEVLTELCARLTREALEKKFSQSKVFENRVREVLVDIAPVYKELISFNPHPYAFPDIKIGEFGIEVKFTLNDTWRSVGNSVFESTRDESVVFVYLVFGKMGGIPEVKWQKYEDSVIHVRTSHVPRFEVEIGTDKNLFNIFGITYDTFKSLESSEKMKYIRKYARQRLGKGERLWWLEDEPNSNHSLPISVKFYTNLDQIEKRKLRAECTLLSPKIFGSSRDRTKYNDVAIFMFTYHGVIAYQTRDLFTAGSVGDKRNLRLNKNYIEEATKDIEELILEACHYLESSLFVEYWGFDVSETERIIYWLKMADSYCSESWVPSISLFKGAYKSKVLMIELPNKTNEIN